MKPKGLLALIFSHVFNYLTYNLLGRKYLRQNRIFRDKYKGKRCFILGSGSSLMKQDLKLLKGEIVFTQNNFHYHKDIKAINPAFHCVVPQYQSSKYNADWIAWFRSMEEQLPAGTVVFAGVNSRKMLLENNLFPNRRYYIDHGLNPVFLRKARVDITKKIMNIPTVLTQCLSIALYMGFSEIYLLGMDLDQICCGQGSDHNRFYGKSHITKNENEVAIDKLHTTTGHAFLFYWWIFQQLNRLAAHAKKAGIAIYNCAPGGLIHTFERKRYEDLPFLKPAKKQAPKRKSTAK